ncbi:unnamed protein product, partial [Ectocarpus sp. 13 AM-2016]
RIEQENDRRKASEVAMRAQIEKELEERVARDIQIEWDRVAAETAALQAKMKEFEEEREKAALRVAAEVEAQKAAEAALVARERAAAESLALGRALSAKADLGATNASKEGISSDRPDYPSAGTAVVLGGYLVGDNVQALCTPVGGATGSKEYISGEVAHVNPDGSLDVILADGRMRQEVPVADIKFVSRSEPQSPAGLSAEEQSFWDGNEQGSEASTGQNGLKGEGGDDASAAAAAVAGSRETPKKRGSLDDILGIKVNRPDRRSMRNILEEGDSVEVLVPPADGNGDGGGGRGGGGGRASTMFALGVVHRVHEDGSVDVELETGRVLLQRPAREVRVVRKGKPSGTSSSLSLPSSSCLPSHMSSSSPGSSSSALALGDLAVGDRVEARYAGKPEFYPGVVTSTEDGVSVNFDKGWHGASIPLKDVRRPNVKPGRNSNGKPPTLSAGARLRSTGCILDLDVGSLGGDTFAIGDQVQFRLTLGLRAGPPQTHNGVIRTAHPNGSYLVGFEDGTTRDQVLVRSLTGFDWTPHGSEAYRRAATDTSQATTAAAAAACPGQGRRGGDGSHGATTGASAVSPFDSRKPSKAPPRGSMFDRLGFPGKVFPDGGGLGGTTGGGGGGSVLQRRATHGGVVDSGEPGLRVDVNMMHFRSQFMDPDTAAQAILTPNNAGMFRPHVIGRGGGGRRGGHRQTASELSYNSTTDESDANRDEDGHSNNRAAGHRPGDHARTKNIEGPRSSSKKNINAARVVPVVSTGSAPKRRMTFGGFRSDKRGEVYKEQRRPSFLEDIGRRATEMAEAAAKATRRISIHGNNGQGFELVAIGDRKQSTHETGRRKSAKKDGKDAGENSSGSDHSENETHFYNRRRHVFEPQHTESAPSAWWIRTIGVINLLCMAAYLWWRITRSLKGVDHIIWAFIFLSAECIMAIGMIVGHSSRSFPAHREKVYMDDLTDVDETIGALKVAVLIPTCGEKTAVMLKALFGNLQLR